MVPKRLIIGRSNLKTHPEVCSLPVQSLVSPPSKTHRKSPKHHRKENKTISKNTVGKKEKKQTPPLFVNQETLRRITQHPSSHPVLCCATAEARGGFASSVGSSVDRVGGAAEQLGGTFSQFFCGWFFWCSLDFKPLFQDLFM